MLIGLFGTGRNGSSLLGRLLDGMEKTYVHPVEERILTAFDDLAGAGVVTRATNQNCRTNSAKHLGRSLKGNILEGYFGASVGTLYEAFIKKCQDTRDLPAISPRELFGDAPITVDAFLRQYLSRLGAYVRPDIASEHFLFKCIETPYIEAYGSLFPDMKFVHIICDPVAVCSSQKRSPMENKNLPAFYLGHDWLTCMLEKRWLPHVRTIRKWRCDARQVTTRYEDLVRDPLRETAKICEALDRAPPPRPDTQTIFHDADMQDWGLYPRKKGVAMPVGVIPDLLARHAYKGTLTPMEIDLITCKTAPYLEEVGYEVPKSPGRGKLIVSHALPHRWDFMHCRTFGSKCRAAIGSLDRRLGLFTSRSSRPDRQREIPKSARA